MTKEEKEKIIAICKSFGLGKQYIIIHDDGTVDVKGAVNLDNKGLTQLPIKFGVVAGVFSCINNNLISLEGCPTHVDRSFDCRYNLLTSLEYSPQFVGGTYRCSHNRLKSLEHCTNEVISFSCNSNQLTSLEHCPLIVHFFFDCSDNQLTSLEYVPTNVRYLNCKRNQLTSIKHAPIIHKGPWWFDYRGNNNLPIEFINLSVAHKKIFIKYQNYYDVWTNGFSHGDMLGLIEDINEGLE